MVQKITGEAPFQVLATNFSISPTQNGEDYTLQISADGTNYSDLFTVSAGQTKMVTNVANGSYYRLKNNTSEVSINWRTQCNDGQGGSGGGVGPQGPAGPQGPQGPAGGGDSGEVQTLKEELENGDVVVGMAKQLYSPDGVTSEGSFVYRTTAGDEDVSTGLAKLQKIEGNASFPETVYNDSVVLMRNGSEVEGFEAEIFWGDNTHWVSATTSNIQSLNAKIARNKLGSTNGYPGWYYGVGTAHTGDMQWKWQNQQLGSQRSTVVDLGDGLWRSSANDGAIANFDGEWLTIDITAVNGDDVYLNAFQDNFIPIEAQALIGSIIPNDIPYGETTYTYDGSDWSETLPQAITAMTINDVDYVPQSGDELVITRSATKTGNASYPAPDSFVALGLNSYNKDADTTISTTEEDMETGYMLITVQTVPNLENGYVVYSNIGEIEGAYIADESGNTNTTTEIKAGKLYVANTTSEYPFIKVYTNTPESICIHPRWSGYMDENYEDYTESVLDVSSFNTDCPLVSIGNVKNIWDFENSILVQNIGVSTYSAQAVQDLIDDGKEIGVDFDFDEDYIYEVLDEPIVTDITLDNEYDANDFSVEYLTQDNDLISIPVYVTTWYMNNLVDKLRRMEGLVHLENLNGTGDENTLYEADGYLWYWSNASGSVAEWTNRPDESGFGGARSYGLIFSHIPDGQTIFEAKYYGDNDSEYRAFKMSGGTLVMTDSANTVLSACTVGHSAEMRVRNNSSSYVVRAFVKEHMIGFDIVGTLSFRNVWDGNVSGGHFCITDHYKYPYLYGVTTDSGIPRWNNKGQIVGKDSTYSTRSLFFNTTGSSSSNRLTVLTNGNNSGPDHFFVPSQSGTQGQILQSNGNAEPTWINWIKVVKITSDDYDALVQAGTTDPNTLYAIVDE